MFWQWCKTFRMKFVRIKLIDVTMIIEFFIAKAGDARVTLTTTDDVDNFDGEKAATTWTREAKLGFVIIELFWIYLSIPVNICHCRCISGVISRERRVIFERTLWRICRGNVYLRYHDFPDEIIDPSTVWQLPLIAIGNINLCCSSFSGKSSGEDGVCDFLSRRSITNTCPKNLRRVRSSRSISKTYGSV